MAQATGCLPSKQEGEFNSQYPRKKGKRERKRERERQYGPMKQQVWEQSWHGYLNEPR
jgi:hypothetical protein